MPFFIVCFSGRSHARFSAAVASPIFLASKELECQEALAILVILVALVLLEALVGTSNILATYWQYTSYILVTLELP